MLKVCLSQLRACAPYLHKRCLLKACIGSIFPGSMTVLPTILYLITGVLRETAVKSTDNLMTLPASAALQGIKTIITSPLAKSDQIHKQWKDLICSSLASILEYSKPGMTPNTHPSVRYDNIPLCASWQSSPRAMNPFISPMFWMTATSPFLFMWGGGAWIVSTKGTRETQYEVNCTQCRSASHVNTQDWYLHNKSLEISA